MQDDRVAEVEKRPASHFRVLQDTVKNFQFSDALPCVVLNPAELLQGIGRVTCRHPTVTFAQDADEDEGEDEERLG